MNNATPHAKMAARTHRKGFSPLPVDGWHKDRDGPWESYKERCIRKGAGVGTDVYGEYIEWITDNGRHRINGPAFERLDGTKAWFVNGDYHRLDGPAIEVPGEDAEFYKDGIKYTDITFTQRFH